MEKSYRVIFINRLFRKSNIHISQETRYIFSKSCYLARIRKRWHVSLANVKQTVTYYLLNLRDLAVKANKMPRKDGENCSMH